MKITFVNRMMGIKFGGGESFDLCIAKELQKLGHEVDLVIGAPMIKEPLSIKDIKVTYIKTPYLRSIHYKIKPTNFLYRLISILAAKADGYIWSFVAYWVLKKKDSDIFQLCGLSHLGAKLSFKGKISSIFWPGPPSKSLKKSILKSHINFAHGDTLNRLKEFTTTLHDIPPGVDLELFSSKKRESKKKVRFLFVGRFIDVKNLDFLIDAFNEAYKIDQNIELVLVGEGTQEQSLKRVINSDITFVGFKSGKELANEYKRADVFCIVSKYESFSIVTLEAMASSLAIIASDRGYLPKLIKDNETGLIISLDDKSALKKAILKLASDKNLRDRLSKNAREFVEQNFSWKKSAKRLEKIYKEKICEILS